MPTGNATTYDLSVGKYLNIEDRIHLLSPTDVPFQNGTDGDGLSLLATEPCHQTEVSWLDEEILTPKSSLAAAVLVGDTAFTVPAGEGLRFGVGDLVLVDAEYVRVTAVNYSTNTLTVTRGYGGSTAAAQSSGAILTIVGKALPEGSDPGTARALDRTKRSNFTQIFGPEQVSVTGTQQVIKKYGIRTSEFDHQLANRMAEAAIAFEQAILYGNKFEDAATKIRTMGGFTSWIQSNVDNSGGALTDARLADKMQACFDKGGAPDRATVGSAQKRVISGFNSSLVRYNAGTPASGGRGQVVDYIDSDFGRIWVALNRWVKSGDLFLHGRDQAVVNVLRPMVFEPLAKTGDSIQGQILCEKTLKFHKERHAARFSGLS